MISAFSLMTIAGKVVPFFIRCAISAHRFSLITSWNRALFFFDSSTFRSEILMFFWYLYLILSASRSCSTSGSECHMFSLLVPVARFALANN